MSSYIENRPSALRRGRSFEPNSGQSQPIINRGRSSLQSGIDEQAQRGQNIHSSERSPVVRGTDTETVAIGLFNGGDCIPIPEGGCVFGREGYASEFLAINPQISRKHAYIKADCLGSIIIRDENSLNGTYIDDGKGRRKIKPNETIELKIGDIIWLGNQIFVLDTIL